MLYNNKWCNRWLVYTLEGSSPGGPSINVFVHYVCEWLNQAHLQPDSATGRSRFERAPGSSHFGLPIINIGLLLFHFHNHWVDTQYLVSRWSFKLVHIFSWLILPVYLVTYAYDISYSKNEKMVNCIQIWSKSILSGCKYFFSYLW